MRKGFRIFLTLALVTVLGVTVLQGATGQVPAASNNILEHALKIELGQEQPAKYQAPISSGVLYAVLQGTGHIDQRVQAAVSQGAHPQGAPGAPNPQSNTGTLGCPNVLTGTGGRRNVRVNQDCSLRRQAEEMIVINPNNPNNIIAGQNDSRIGYNHCGYDFSFDGGKTWGDMVPPFWQFVLLDGHTSDVCSDPTAAFDLARQCLCGWDHLRRGFERECNCGC